MKKNDSTAFILYQITDVTDNTGWYTLSIAHQSSSDTTPFNTTGQDILLSFLTNGRKGARGFQGYTGFHGFHGYTGCHGFQ